MEQDSNVEIKLGALREALKIALAAISGGHMSNDKIEILLVDDDEVDREVVKKALKSINPGITEATTGTEGLELLSKTVFSLILLDYKLPDVEGLELITKIRQVVPETPIIIITGFGNEDLVMTTSEMGVLDYIPKNKITPEFLVRTILNDLLIYKSNKEKETAQAELAKQKQRDIAVLSDIIELAKKKLEEYDKPNGKSTPVG